MIVQMIIRMVVERFENACMKQKNRGSRFDQKRERKPEARPSRKAMASSTATSIVRSFKFSNKLPQLGNNKAPRCSCLKFNLGKQSQAQSCKDLHLEIVN
jgi:hypothetical protein